MTTAASSTLSTTTTINNFSSTVVENAKFKSREKKHKVKRNLESDTEEIIEKIICENSNKISDKNLKLAVKIYCKKTF